MMAVLQAGSLPSSQQQNQCDLGLYIFFPVSSYSWGILPLFRFFGTDYDNLEY